MKKRVLYIEDEPFLARIVRETMELKGYEVLHLPDGNRITESIRSFSPDICLFDIMLPHVDGYTLGSMVRNIYPRLPIIFITAKTQTDDVLMGFSSGGTDYIKKPFSMEELMARIENQLKLAAATAQTITVGEEIKLGTISFYPHRFELQHNGKVIKLSSRESQILNILSSNKNNAVDRRQLLHLVWGDDSFFNSRNLDVYIRKLRDYLSPEPAIEIVTLKGKGYHFIVPETSK